MRSELSFVRSLVVRLVVGSFALAALLGVAALLSPGRFGSIQARILLTTMIVGATSVLTLCYLAVGGAPRRRWIGLAGGVSALVASCCLLVIVWAHWQHDPGLGLLRTFGVSGIAALTLAQFSLLVAVVQRPGSLVRMLLATVVAGTVLGALLIAAVLGWEPGEAGGRLIGVIAILDVLGTVVTIAIAVFGGESRGTPAAALTVTVPEPWAGRLRERAEATGRPVTDLVVEAVVRYGESADAGPRA
jgi:hypothetical protein